MKNIFTAIFLCLFVSSYSQIVQTFITSGSFTVPADVFTISVECWGSGGSGGGAIGSASFRAVAGGGGGGGYSSGSISVTPGDIITYIVAPQTLAATTTPVNGSSSVFGSIFAAGGIGAPCLNASSAHLSGAGGNGGIGSTNNGGAGGSRVGYAGETSGWSGGGGGGGAGTMASGGDAASGGAGTSNAGGTGGTLIGGTGGAGRNVSSGGGNGSTGLVVSAGGGGAYAAASTTQRSGGTGARGQIRITYISPLPIKISSFSVKNNKSKNTISFSTSSEINNDYFTIESSVDGQNFDEIGNIKGAGNSNEEKTYSFLDENPSMGINYYRLRQTDFDGTSTYSDVKSTRVQGDKNITVSPRNTSGKLYITTTIEHYNVYVYAVSGQRVKSFDSMSQDQSISIDDLIAGTYYIRVQGENTTETVRIIKM